MRFAVLEVFVGLGLGANCSKPILGNYHAELDAGIDIGVNQSDHCF